MSSTFIDPFSAEPSRVGAADHFRGRARVHDLATALGATSGVEVNGLVFEPEARSRPHRHDRDQIVFFLSPGIVALDGGADEPVAAGQIVVLPAGVPHMHGAGPDAPTRHLSIMPAGHSNEFDCPIPAQWLVFRELP